MTTIKLSDKNADVLRAQTLLKEKGFYAGALDSDFGPKTEAAVKAFQSANKLVADGIVGPKTWEKLLAAEKPATAPTSAPAPVSTPSAKTLVCIDPGHTDGYNHGLLGYVEGNRMYDLAVMLQKALTTLNISSKLTRMRSENPSLSARGKMAADMGAKLFISLHSDASGGTITTSDQAPDWVTAYHSVDIPADLSLARAFADAVAAILGVKAVAKVWQSTNYPGEDYLTVIDSAQDGGVPHVLLVEHGFHTNPAICQSLMQNSTLQLIAKAEAALIAKIMGISTPAPSPTPAPTPKPAPTPTPTPTPASPTPTAVIDMLRSEVGKLQASLQQTTAQRDTLQKQVDELKALITSWK